MKLPEVDWLINGEPREVQLEALRRSFYGYSLKDSKDGEENPVVLREGLLPTRGWGHLMEMRLGKTPTILNEFALLHKMYDFERLVVFSPNQYKKDWALENEKYGLPVPMHAYSQTKIKHAEKAWKESKGKMSFVVNYEALQFDKTLDFLDTVMDSRTLLVADESIIIKNRESLFTKGAMKLRENVAVTRIATGLPMSQGPTDFYSQAKFIGMYDGYDYYAYRGKYCVMGGFKRKAVKGTKNDEQLEAEIKSSSFVAKRKDWGNQSGAEHYRMRLDMAPEQQKHYTEMNQDLITLVENIRGEEEEISAEQVVGKLMKMQQISSGFVYTADGDALEIMDPSKTPKMKALLMLLENEVKGKLVIPYHYAKSGDLLLKVLAKYNPAAILGDVRMRKQGLDVVSEKARFNNDPNCRVMIGNLATMKYGHDLTGINGDRCATMFFYENNYSLDNRTQVEARITTAFQDWENIYIDPYCSQTELNGVEALIAKRNIVEAVLGPYRADRKDGVEYVTREGGTDRWA